MHPFLSFLFRSSTAIITTGAVWVVSFLGFDQTVLLSTAYSFGGGILAYSGLSAIMKARFLKKHHLTLKEYRYIKKNLDEAKSKLSRLHKALLSIRHLPSLKQRFDLTRTTRKIYHLTKKEPRRFYQAEGFYFSHLDSLVELTEKYVFLSSQPKRNQEIDNTLSETRDMLEELSNIVENDLYKILEEDIDHLHFEMDVAKHSIKTLEDLKEESRKHK